ncbi:hypothetical protein [Isoptericola sp. NPDC019482]|uniref:hypothetical protein n=1 Tax=Isoptericola sp. NPDC019482 TaxID=3154688 RepID=UPI00346D7B19
MTSSVPPSLFPDRWSSPASRAACDAASSAALAAHHDVVDAAASARRSLAVAWESTAADRFRDEVAALLADLDVDLALLELAAEGLAR